MPRPELPLGLKYLQVPQPTLIVKETEHLLAIVLICRAIN